MRALVVRTSALGDVVLTTPFLRALAGHLGAPVEVLTSPPYAPLFEGLPFVSRVWSLPKESGGRELLRALREGGTFDVAVDLQNKARTLAILLRLPARRRFRLVKRKGVSGALGSLFGGGPILDGKPAAAVYFEAVEGLGLRPSDLRPEVALRPEAVARAEELAARAGGAPIVGLAPGARWDLKRWSPERFAAVGAALQEQGAEILLVGGPGDREELDRVREGLVRPALGDTVNFDVAELAAALARLSLLVSVDSGPAHLAQAVGTPVLSIFGPTSHRRWGPAPGQGGVLALPLACSPCTNYGKGHCAHGDRACLEALPVEIVIEAARAVLRAGREGGGAAAERACRATVLELAQRVASMQRPFGRTRKGA
jgi:heptosyltransferase-2